jgi:hypothetical protein
MNDAKISTSSLRTWLTKCASAIPASTRYASSMSASTGQRNRPSSDMCRVVRRRPWLFSFESPRRGRFAGVRPVLGDGEIGRTGSRGWCSRDEGGGGSSAESGDGYTLGTRSKWVRYWYIAPGGMVVNLTCSTIIMKKKESHCVPFERLTRESLPSTTPSTPRSTLLTPFRSSTRFLFGRGSPSALSPACLFAPAPALAPCDGPKYPASSLGFLRACGRDREPDVAGATDIVVVDMVAGMLV